VSVGGENASVGPFLVELGLNQLLDCEHHSVLAAQPDGGSAKLRKLFMYLQFIEKARVETHPLFSTAFCAYSTWKTRPSGENCEADRSY
jgi:hypothetical protein